MARAMYEYTKSTLKKVSFDSTLFIKEFNKGMTRLLDHEKEDLKNWLKSEKINYPECHLADCKNLSEVGSWFCDQHNKSSCYACQGGGCPVCGGFGEIIN